MTMYEAFHSRDDIDRLYVPRKEGGRTFVCIKDSVDASIRKFEVDIKKIKEKLITDVSNRINIRTNRTRKTRKKET